MPRKPSTKRERRALLLAEIGRLADAEVFGTPSESYRTCGNPGCRCHGPGPKHGPHLYVHYRGESGKTTSYYVPAAAQGDIRAGISAWHALQERLRELAELNKERALEAARRSRDG
jgi:hypothetical protein